MNTKRWMNQLHLTLHRAKQTIGKRLVLLLLRRGAYRLAWRVYRRLFG